VRIQQKACIVCGCEILAEPYLYCSNCGIRYHDYPWVNAPQGDTVPRDTLEVAQPETHTVQGADGVVRKWYPGTDSGSWTPCGPLPDGQWCVCVRGHAGAHLVATSSASTAPPAAQPAATGERKCPACQHANHDDAPVCADCGCEAL